MISAAVWGLIGGTLIGIGVDWPGHLWQPTTLEDIGKSGLGLAGYSVWQCGVAVSLVSAEEECTAGGGNGASE